MSGFLQKGGVFVLIAVIVLTANFYGHVLSTLPVKRFLNNEFPSESFVISRMAYNEARGTAGAGGFMVRYPYVDELFMANDKEPYRDFTQRGLAQIDTASVYNSHLGLQDNVLSPLWTGLRAIRDYVQTTSRDGSRWQERMEHYDAYYMLQVSQFCVALFNALVLSLILLWVFRQFSSTTAWITFGLMLLLMPALTFFGRSMWWMEGVWFLPFLFFSFAYLFKQGKPMAPLPLLAVSVLAGLALTVKTGMGYEYTSTIMVSAVTPATFYGILNRWTFRAWFIQCLVIGLTQLGGFALALWLHYEALAAAGFDPLEVIMDRFTMRAYGGEAIQTLDNNMIRESLDAGLLTTYARQFFQPQGVGIPQAVIMLPLFLWLWRRCKHTAQFTPEQKALLACIGLGFFGALSMYTILKGHAFIHGYDVVAWSIPMNILICVFYARGILGRKQT